MVTSGCPYYDRPGVASFHQFAVDPDLQGDRIGRRLLDLVEDRAAATGATEIALDTAVPATHLIAMYERRGYRIVDRVDWDETNYVSVIMARPASPPAVPGGEVGARRIGVGESEPDVGSDAETGT
jgi:hypothetical protein